MINQVSINQEPGVRHRVFSWKEGRQAALRNAKKMLHFILRILRSPRFLLFKVAFPENIPVMQTVADNDKTDSPHISSSSAGSAGALQLLFIE